LSGSVVERGNSSLDLATRDTSEQSIETCEGFELSSDVTSWVGLAVDSDVTLGVLNRDDIISDKSNSTLTEKASVFGGSVDRVGNKRGDRNSSRVERGRAAFEYGGSNTVWHGVECPSIQGHLPLNLLSIHEIADAGTD